VLRLVSQSRSSRAIGRRLVVRYERHALNYLAFVHLGCIRILLRHSL
jgi:transposase